MFSQYTTYITATLSHFLRRKKKLFQALDGSRSVFAQKGAGGTLRLSKSAAGLQSTAARRVNKSDPNRAWPQLHVTATPFLTLHICSMTMFFLKKNHPTFKCNLLQMVL